MTIIFLIGGVAACLPLAVLWQGSDLNFVAACLFIVLLAFASAVDIQTRLVPRLLPPVLLVVSTVTTLGEGIAASHAPIVVANECLQMFVHGAIAMVPLLLLAIVMEHMVHAEVLGGGDIRLFFCMGCFLGVVTAWYAIALACVAALVGVVVLRQRTFPFVPALTVGCYLVLLAGI